jgi:hypothetical protein
MWSIIVPYGVPGELKRLGHSSSTITASVITKDWGRLRLTMYRPGAVLKYCNAERRHKYKRLTTTETTIGPRGSLFTAPECSKVFGSKIVLFHCSTTIMINWIENLYIR